MKPELIARIVARWVRRYTRRLPADVAARRAEEVDADVADQIEHERALGSRDRRIAREILSRALRGAAADVSWRRDDASAARGRGVAPAGALVRDARAVATVTGILLLVPLIAMQLGGGVEWTAFDFAAAAALLGSAGMLLRIGWRRAGSAVQRMAVVGALGSSLMLAWVDLAVGVIGEPEEPINAAYLLVLAIGIGGAIGARLRPLGMARTLYAMALAQTAVAAAALLAGKHAAPISSVGEILGVNAMFAAMFVGSALLYRASADAGRRAVDPSAQAR